MPLKAGGEAGNPIPVWHVLEKLPGYRSSPLCLQAHFSDYAPWFGSPRKGAPGVLRELVERLLLECRRHRAGLLDDQQRQLRRKTAVSTGR